MDPAGEGGKSAGVTIEIELDGVRRQVTLRRGDGDQWIAAIDGHEVTVSAAQAGGRWSMLVGPAEAGHHDAKSYDVAFEPTSAGELIVSVNGIEVPLAIVDRRHPSSGGREGSDAAQPRVVIAPMPGRIVRVLVKPGEEVAARQGLIVVEAMKMENELRARAAGTVSEVRVTEGASVEAGAILVILA